MPKFTLTCAGAFTGALFLILLMPLAACQEPNPTVSPLVAENDPVAFRIAQASEKAAKALNTVAGIEQYRNPLPPMEDFMGAPHALSQPVTITWNGPAEQLVQTLAAKAGYAYRTAGMPTPVPLTVAVDVYERPLIDILRDIGLQLGNRADVAVDAKAGAVQLRYAPTDGKI
ncbi:MAG: DotD/TraH family lipoprotein [Alphaproteobacteria bacterium]